MMHDEILLKALIDTYGINGVKAAITEYASTGNLKLRNINNISDDMIDEIIESLYRLADDLYVDPGSNIKVIKDKRSKGEQYVQIQFRYNHNIGFRIMDNGNYSLVYMTGLGKVVSRDLNFDMCLDNFSNKFEMFVKKIYNN